MEQDKLNRHGPFNSEALNDLATQYMRREFGITWEVDSAKLAQWLAENNHIFAGLADDDEVERVIAAFRKELDRVVRVALGDFEAMEELVATAKRIEGRAA